MEYREGVSQFLELAKYHVDNYGQTMCQCKRCMNSIWDSLEGMERHLLTIGIPSSYTNLVYHGEPVNLHRGIQRFDEGISNSNFFYEETISNPFPEENKMFSMFHDLQASIEHVEEINEGLENDMSFRYRTRDNKHISGFIE